MSVASPQLPSGVPKGPAWQRSLRAVRPRRTSAARLPFVVLVSALLIGGVVGLLMFNTSMQQAAFTETKLQEQATNLAAREQTMSMELQTTQDPQQVAKKARKLGMVLPQSPAILHVPSGEVSGKPDPGNVGAIPPLYPNNPPPPAALKAQQDRLAAHEQRQRR